MLSLALGLSHLAASPAFDPHYSYAHWDKTGGWKLMRPGPEEIISPSKTIRKISDVGIFTCHMVDPLLRAGISGAGEGSSTQLQPGRYCRKKSY